MFTLKVGFTLYQACWNDWAKKKKSLWNQTKSMILTFKFRCTGNYGDLLHSFIELKIFFFMTSQRLFANRNHGIPKKPIWVFNFIENQNRIILIKNILKHDLQMKTFMIHDNFFFFFGPHSLPLLTKVGHGSDPSTATTPPNINPHG